MAKPRLFVETLLDGRDTIALEGDAHHYVARVMRMRVGDVVELFDGQNDAVDAEITASTKRETELRVIARATPFRLPPDITLAFAPIKKARTDFIVEKAAELGARTIQPMQTEFTNAERIRQDRLARHAVEAAEQCGGTYVPPVMALKTLDAVLAENSDRQIIFADETAPNGQGMVNFARLKADKWLLLIGPEGGFSENERTRIADAGGYTLSLGPRILRADTAAVALLTLMQSTHGDW